jgi:hypothetical protein
MSPARFILAVAGIRGSRFANRGGWVVEMSGRSAGRAHHLEKSASDFDDSESFDAPQEWFRCLCLLFLSRLGVLLDVTRRRIRLIVGIYAHVLWLAIWASRMGHLADLSPTPGHHSCVRNVEPTEGREQDEPLHGLRPQRDQGAQLAPVLGSACAAPRGAVARGARIERFAIGCLRQEGREAAAARDTPQGVAMVSKRAGL